MAALSKGLCFSSSYGGREEGGGGEFDQQSKIGLENHACPQCSNEAAHLQSSWLKRNMQRVVKQVLYRELNGQLRTLITTHVIITFNKTDVNDVTNTNLNKKKRWFFFHRQLHLQCDPSSQRFIIIKQYFLLKQRITCSIKNQCFFFFLMQFLFFAKHMTLQIENRITNICPGLKTERNHPLQTTDTRQWSLVSHCFNQY